MTHLYVLVALLVFLMTTQAHSHPGDHDHCEQPPVGSQQCH